jgi:hypothetical protein
VGVGSIGSPEHRVTVEFHNMIKIEGRNSEACLISQAQTQVLQKGCLRRFGNRNRVEIRGRHGPTHHGAPFASGRLAPVASIAWALFKQEKRGRMNTLKLTIGSKDKESCWKPQDIRCRLNISSENDYGLMPSRLVMQSSFGCVQGHCSGTAIPHMSSYQANRFVWRCKILAWT